MLFSRENQARLQACGYLKAISSSIETAAARDDSRAPVSQAGGTEETRRPSSSARRGRERRGGKIMKASFLFTAAALAIAASAAPSTARDKFGPWGPPVNLGRTINSACANQACESERPAISRDNLSLYFDSNRPGGSGRHDIWVSHRASVNDPWEIPKNLGPPVNTAVEEFSPNLSPNGHWLFFGSTRPGGCAGLDIWASHRRDRDDDFAWETPVNLGCTLNTSADDDFPFLFVDNEEDTTMLYFASNRSFGGYHIYVSTMNEEDGTFGPGVLVPNINCFRGCAPGRREGRTPAVRARSAQPRGAI